MNKIRISTAQFENKSADKDYNLSVIERLAFEAAAGGAQVIAFHECSVTGYTFARNLSKEQMLELAEPIPDGESVRKLIEVARKADIAILAGLFEKDENDQLLKPMCVSTKTGW